MAPKRNTKKLILASGSPQRRHLLKKAGYRFKIVPSSVKESYPRGLKPQAIVQYLALKKARDVAKQHPDSIVLGADTLVFLGNKALGKPRNLAHAQKMLGALSGRWQKVMTGVALVWGGEKEKTGVGISSVKIKSLSPDLIQKAVRKHLDKAGAYAIQDKKDPLVQSIRGDYDNVVGLPLRVVRRLLKVAR